MVIKSGNKFSSSSETKDLAITGAASGYSAMTAKVLDMFTGSTISVENSGAGAPETCQFVL